MKVTIVEDREYGVATPDDDMIVGGFKATVVSERGRVAITGRSGLAVAGPGGTAIADDEGIAAAGVEGIAWAREGGRAMADDRGVLVLEWFDGERTRLTVAYVGEDGIKPNTYYRVNERGEVVPA